MGAEICVFDLPLLMDIQPNKQFPFHKHSGAIATWSVQVMSKRRAKTGIWATPQNPISQTKARRQKT
jgi:hypothetical protein